MQDIHEQYTNGSVGGWLGEEEAKNQWATMQNDPAFVPFPTFGYQASRRMMLYEVTRKVLGKDTENYAQQIGDCVSFGMKNAIEYLQCCEILSGGELQTFRKVFPPYLYGTGRVFVGGGRIGGDGSLGSWQAAAVIKYGVLASDESGVPGYSGSLARQWGRNPGPPQEFVSLAKVHPVQSAAKINNWDEFVQAICNGYPCTIASDVGFTMEARGDFHEMSGSWAHQMCGIGVDDEHTEPYAIIVNSWGDAHGRLKDLKTGEDLPVGCLRVRKKAIERMISQQEVFAISQLTWFEEQRELIERALFRMI